MLFEKTTYPDDFPFKIRILQITEYPVHYHQDIEFIFVLKGSIKLKNMCHHYYLKAGDVFTNSGHEVHGLTATNEDNVVALIQISTRYFTQYFPSLNRACFMTYVDNDKYANQDQLQKMLLSILLDHSRISLNYKSSCIEKMIEILHHLNHNYNLFAFEEMTVVNFRSNNPITVERISRITDYIYTNHSRKITLQEVAEREHLSTYYLSHLIRDNIGISFQELLCFARAEMSEILLLESNLKISEIAKEVGFSATAYYNKYFIKWYGHSPAEHRNQYIPLMLSNKKPLQVQLLSDNQAISLLSQRLSAVRDQDSSLSIINRLNLKVNISPEEVPIKKLSHNMDIVITQEDYNIMGERLFNILHELNAPKVIVAGHLEDNETTTTLIINRLNFMGYDVTTKWDCGDCFFSSSGYDSISSAIDVLLRYFTPGNQNMCFRLRDQGAIAKMLKGYSSCLTSSMVAKPSFYAYKLVNNLKGELIHMGKYHYVIKADTNSYILIVMNYSNEIRDFVNHEIGVYEVKEIIDDFKDELLVAFNLPLDTGTYVVATYALDSTNSIFSHMANLKFPNNFLISESWIRMLNTAPQSQIRLESVNNSISIHEAIRGVGIKITTIKKVKGLE